MYDTHALKIVSTLSTDQAEHIMSELVYEFDGVAYVEKQKEIFKLEEDENIEDLKEVIYSDDMDFSSIIQYLEEENIEFKTGVIDNTLEVAWNK